jgi:hypothetical protein
VVPFPQCGHLFWAVCMPGLSCFALSFFFSPFLSWVLSVLWSLARFHHVFLGSKVFFFQFCDVASR